MSPKPHESEPAGSDAALLEAWRAGDTQAGEALFVRHYDTLARFFRNKVSADQVADLIQETLTTLVESRDRIADSSRFRAYMLCIAYRVFCKHLRGSYRADAVRLEELSVAELGTTPSSLIARAQEQRLLLEGLRALPVNYQVVLELYYWEELNTVEIAEVLGVPSGTVRTRLQRARDALEAELARLARSRELLDSTLTRLEQWAASCKQELVGSANLREAT
jgi:RNA polymerase sigma-70 factor (ECF subfamily)